MIDFNDLISNYLKRELKEKQIGKYYPSEAGSCLRKLFYSYKIPKLINQELIKIFEVGNLLHEFITKVIESEKNPHVELLEREVPFKLEINNIIISGRIDNIILLKINGIIYIVEIKSTSSLKHTENPNLSSILQLQLYMHFKKIHNGLILYIEKNTLKTKTFEVKYDQEQAQLAIDRLLAIHSHLTNNKLPEPEAKLDEEMLWQCKFCDYQEECGNNHNI